ncbi:MAG: hypothetical protein JKY56_26335 [Kofleriaceae bacterium]|nr:hypothetical protein [Kofleriaceae bacterium]
MVSRRSARARYRPSRRWLACAIAGLSITLSSPLLAQEANKAGAGATTTIGDYFEEFEKSGFIDVDGGSRKSLIVDLRRAEALLRGGSSGQAAVAFYAIVESPRYQGFEDFVEFQNSQYYLGVALKRSGAFEAALQYFMETMAAGPSSLYFGPAHRKAVDIALLTRRPRKVLKMLEAVKFSEVIPPAIAGERSYLKARASYEDGEYPAAEAELVKISRKSRLYSSALYLRGVIRTRKAEFAEAAASFCEISATPDDDKYTFVVDDRYFRIKDLARLGLARIAHETQNYDNAYYHYFQIPEDSDKLGDALFEAAWSMYQKRELATSRILVKDFLSQFPNSPLVPEGRLLAGYIELADCKFDDAQKQYDKLVKDLSPIIDEIEAIRQSPDKRSRLFDRALKRWRAEKAIPDEALVESLTTKADRVLALLRFDDKFVQAHEAVSGLRMAAGNAPHVSATWQNLSTRIGTLKVRSNSQETSMEQEEAQDSQALVRDLQRLRDKITQARNGLRGARRDNSISEAEAEAEVSRLKQLESDISALEDRAIATAEANAIADSDTLPDGIKPLVRADIKQSKELENTANDLLIRLEARADLLASKALDKLHTEARRVLDKAKLGKIDAVIGQKRRLEIEVQDLAAGRFPAELHGHLWEQGLIDDDEEFWPFEGEYWADEYEGWR